MKDLAIYGAGGYGREVACLIHAINEVKKEWNLIGFFDDVKEVGYRNEYGEVFGGYNVLNAYSSELSVVFAIGNPQGVANLVEKIHNPNIEYPNIIAADILFFDQNTIQMGFGNIIGFKSSISCNVHLGNFNRLNGSISIGHDVFIGNFNMFNPSTRISGDVRIGDCNFFGVGSIVLQKKQIGNYTTIGANSVVMKKTKDNTTYIGNPAIELKY